MCSRIACGEPAKPSNGSRSRRKRGAVQSLVVVIIVVDGPASTTYPAHPVHLYLVVRRWTRLLASRDGGLPAKSSKRVRAAVALRAMASQVKRGLSRQDPGNSGQRRKARLCQDSEVPRMGIGHRSHQSYPRNSLSRIFACLAGTFSFSLLSQFSPSLFVPACRDRAA